MNKKLTVIITNYQSKKQTLKLFSLLPKNNVSYEILLINDHYDEEIYKDDCLTIVNNIKNVGKFWAISDNIDHIKTDYFLTVDPDDVFEGGIDWDRLEKLSKKMIENSEGFDFGVNTYKICSLGKCKKHKSKHILTYFTPNMILNTKNVKEIKQKLNLVFEGQKLTFFEDVLLLLMSYGKGKKQNFNNLFYSYMKLLGVTSEFQKYKDEMFLAKEISSKILSHYNSLGIVIEENITLKRVKRIDEYIRRFR